jgi:TusA-related sulfurtransferase
MENEIKPNKTLDCIGLYCPEPLFQTREVMDTLEIGDILEVLVDDPAAKEDITRFVKRTGHKIVTIEMDNNGFRFLIKKTN